MIRSLESFDGFHQTNGEPINTGAAFATKWTLDSGTAETTQAGRDTGKACGLTGAARITRNLATIVTPCIGFALKIVSAGDSLLCLPRFNSNTSRAQLVLNADRTLSVRRGSTVLATTDPLDLDVWYYIEFKTKMTFTGGSYEVRIDGVTALADPSVSMDDTGTSGMNNISFGAGSGVEVHIDDFYILDCDDGIENVDFLGPVKVDHYRPVMNAGPNEWTANTGENWEAVSEAPPDGDTTYVETSTPGAVDLFVMGKFSN